jgi:hypothetical protein
LGDVPEAPPDEPLIDLDVRFGGCGITAAAGRILCWSGGSLLARIPVPLDSQGGFSRIGIGSHQVCALETSGSIHCWTDGSIDDYVGNDAPMDAFIDINGGSYGICAVASNGSGNCWGIGIGCGIETDGDVTCWGEIEAGGRPMPDGFKALVE